jgi:hypothetical protein
MAAPITYTRQFSHRDWIDFVDSVQAGGTNGINSRMHAIEAEFDKLSQVVSAINTVLQSQPGLTITNFAGVDVPGGNLSLVIIGNGFTAPATVEFQKTSTTFTTPVVLLTSNVTPTQLLIPIDQIPVDAVTGKVRVQSAGQTITSSFDVTPPATIANFTSPVTGNQLCTINGTRFIPGTTTITFANGSFRAPSNGFPGTGESLTAAQIVVRVPATSPAGPIKISTPGGTVQTTTSLVVN